MKTLALPLTASALLIGCVAGPDYAGPPVAAPVSTARGAFANAGGETAAAAPVAADWWRALGDPELDWLIEVALTSNTDLAAATARIDQARAVLRERRGDAGPNASVNARYSRTRPSIAAFGIDVPGFEARDIDLVEGALDASWELDFAGRRQRAVEGARADLDASEATLEDGRVRVAAETALAYLSLRAADRRIALAEEDTRVQAQTLDLVRARRRLGAASDLDVSRAETLLTATRAQREPLIAERAAQEARLAVLTGREPGDARVASNLAPLPSPPSTIAVGSPGDLIARRPDVRAAERRLAAATAGIGVATAELYPRVSLIGSVGVQNDGLFNLGDGFTYRIGPTLSWSFLDLDRVRTRIAQADARRAEELATYRGTVLGALEDAEASLARYRQTGAEFALRLLGVYQARRAAELANLRYQSGAGSLIEVLDAERDRVAAERVSLDAAAARAAAFVQLSKALGLAWSPSLPSTPLR